ncbi:MAG: patatin-like phospholipase family protein [Acidimicrobiales bacterium]
MAHAEVPLDRAGEGQAKPGPRHGVALCLSGGGYRAALFHLGAARRLNELGLLGAVGTVTAVSGGSIFAAHLARHLAVANGMWPPVAGVVPGWEAGVAGPVREMATRNLRAPAMLSRRRWATSWRDHALAAALAATGGGDMARLALRDLPRRPRFVFCATDLQFGDQWTFDTGAQRLGSSKAGFLSPLPSGWSLASAVAASCCVPYAFAPFRVKGLAGDLRCGSYQGADRRARAARIDLGDGGLYDNLGLEPVWDDHAVLFVSDCAPSYAGVQGTTRAWPALRPFVILLDQATNVRRRWLASEISGQRVRGAWWGTGVAPPCGDARTGPAYSDDFVDHYISRARVDLDGHSPEEAAVIENHGYLAADRAIGRSFDDLALGPHLPPVPPHPEWMDEARARRALADSSKVTLLGRSARRLRAAGQPARSR